MEWLLTSQSMLLLDFVLQSISSPLLLRPQSLRGCLPCPAASARLPVHP